MDTISKKMQEFFSAKDAKSAVDLICQANTPTKQTNAMYAADKAGFGVEFYPGGSGLGIRVWIPK
jgi:hypothetical protein